MNLKYTIESLNFHVDQESGSLIVQTDIEAVEVPHLVAIELIELIRAKLYAHSDKSESLLNKLFK